MEQPVKLSARVEASDGSYDPRLCSDIHDILPEPKCVQPPNYLASLDAAMSLGRDDWERADALVDALQHLGNPDFLTNGEWSKLLPIRVVANLLKLRGL